MHSILFKFAIAITMTSVFVVMFWAVQVGGAATAAARAKAGPYAAVTSGSIQRLQPVY
jgi:hypothetical protein